MKNIFIGFIFIFLNFNITIGSSTISLMPSFIGYLLLIRGITELSKETEFFMKVLPISKGAFIYSLIVFILDLIGIRFRGIFDLILGLVYAMLHIYISYHIILGISKLEKITGKDLNSRNLLTYWKISAICICTTYLMISFVPMLSMMAILINFCMVLLFLYGMYKCKNQYYM